MPRPTRLRQRRHAFLAAFVTTLAAASFASDEPARLPEFFVPGQRVGALEITVPADELRAPTINPGVALLSVPGVFGQSRSIDAPEPNIRGLSLDRVATSLNGIPLVNASPERTHSPVVTVGGVALSDIHVIKSLPSVTLGPATTGGRIELSTDTAPARSGEPRTMSGELVAWPLS
jgi:hypothetical protein